MKVIHGIASIASIVGKHRNTVSNWIKRHGFPAARGPDGVYMTTHTLIDQWILSRAELSRRRDNVQGET